MFRLSLFRLRPFTAGNLASLLSGLGRGGLMFILRGGRYVHEEHGQAEAAAASAGDDLEGRQGGVLRVGDPAPVGRHLAQRA
jgi:hypothetical protein